MFYPVSDSSSSGVSRVVELADLANKAENSIFDSLKTIQDQNATVEQKYQAYSALKDYINMESPTSSYHELYELSALDRTKAKTLEKDLNNILSKMTIEMPTPKYDANTGKLSLVMEPITDKEGKTATAKEVLDNWGTNNEEFYSATWSIGQNDFEHLMNTYSGNQIFDDPNGYLNKPGFTWLKGLEKALAQSKDTDNMSSQDCNALGSTKTTPFPINDGQGDAMKLVVTNHKDSVCSGGIHRDFHLESNANAIGSASVATIQGAANNEEYKRACEKQLSDFEKLSGWNV